MGIKEYKIRFKLSTFLKRPQYLIVECGSGPECDGGGNINIEDYECVVDKASTQKEAEEKLKDWNLNLK